MTTTPIIPLADLIADLRTQPTTIAAQTAADRLEEMAAELDEAQLRSIEARNPGIDMEEVKRLRQIDGAR